MSRPVIILGAGGHARVAVALLRALGIEPRGAAAPGDASSVAGVEIIGDDDTVLALPADSVTLVNGLGTVRADDRRREIFERFHSQGFRFSTLCHPAAFVADDATLFEGVQIMAGAVVQCGVRIGANSIVNTSASVDHDCVIGAHVHIAPGVTLSGAVAVADGAHIGVGASVVQSVSIGAGCTVGAGSVVLADLEPGRTYIGVPAREV